MTPSGPALFVLGGLDLKGLPEDRADSFVAQSKPIALLAYLLLSARGTFQRRDRLAALLWPELDQQHARAALRKAVHMVRSALGDQVLISRGEEDVTIDHDHLWCDAVDLRDCIERGHFARAVELYRGDLLPGFHLSDCHDFDAWLEDRRTELHEAAINACMSMARTLESELNGTEAGRFARKAARLAGSNERVLRRCLIMLDRLGDRAGALVLYEEFENRLRKLMDAAPSPETVSLAEALRAGRSLS